MLSVCFGTETDRICIGLTQFSLSFIGCIAVPVLCRCGPMVTDGSAFFLLLVCLSVCLFVCLSVTIVSPAKTAELMEMPFCLWTQVGPRNFVLDGGSDLAMERGNFDGERGGPL